MQTGAATLTSASKRRDALVTAHLHLVDPIARAVRRRLPRAFELEDLTSAGHMGLIRAAERYRPRGHNGAPFAAYARPCILGAIRSSVRRAWCDGRGRHALRPLAEALPAGDGWLTADDSRERIEAFDASRRIQTITQAVETLPASQQRVLQAVYLGAGTVSAAARGLGMAPGRAYRLHKLGIKSLQAMFAAA
jgi:RNA polymerase sporulation-specific sigma factor